MAPIRVLSVVGTRPNFMKIAPVAAELARRGDAFEHTLVHTGQHYDAAMSEIFFEPLGYLEFLSLLADAAGALTDSGGIQEETTFLGVPCLTLRDNTERPVTVDMGTNVLLGLRPERIAEAPELIREVRSRDAQIPPGWDGAASGRIADVLAAPAA